jgi:signal transduction histidine kinase
MRSRRAGAIVVAGASFMTTIVGIQLAREHAPQRWPYEAWSTADVVVWSLGAASGTGLALAAGWLSWRLPTNPTGWWLSVTALAFAAWIAGGNWSGPVSPWFEELLPPVFKATAVLAVVPWPTGRLEPRWARPFNRAVALYLVLALVEPFVGYRFSLWIRDDWRLPSIGGLVPGYLTELLAYTLLGGLAPCVLLAALVRRQAMVPSPMRRSVRPAFIGVGVLALTEVWVAVTNVALAPLGTIGMLWSRFDTVRSAVDLGRFVVVAGLLVVAELARHRGAGRATARTIELGPAERDVDVAGLLGDPSARVVDAAVSLAAVRQARRADADARTSEVRHAQRRVLEAQDRARRRLERDLHDGVQQRMVAVALEASMLARHESLSGCLDATRRQALRASIDDAVRHVDAVLAERTPAVVAPGLAAGLHALGATVPMSTVVEIDGDIAGDCRAAAVLWFVAAEAVANTLKHADATELFIGLNVQPESAALTVRDNGTGGEQVVSTAIGRRLSTMPSSLDIASVPGGGTTVLARVDLTAESSTREPPARNPSTRDAERP